MSQDYGQATIDGPVSGLRTESPDRIHDALADERRRAALSYLAGTGVVSRRELVEHVAADSPGADGDRPDLLAVQFHHRHLPKLAAAGLVDYDEERGRVYPTETADRVARWLADR